MVLNSWFTIKQKNAGVAKKVSGVVYGFHGTYRKRTENWKWRRGRSVGHCILCRTRLKRSVFLPLKLLRAVTELRQNRDSYFCNIACNNFSASPPSTTWRAKISTRVHYLHIARNHFNVSPLSTTWCTSNWPRVHCSQQFQYVSTICKIAHGNFKVCSTISNISRNNLLQHCCFFSSSLAREQKHEKK